MTSFDQSVHEGNSQKKNGTARTVKLIKFHLISVYITGDVVLIIYDVTKKKTVVYCIQ